MKKWSYSMHTTMRRCQRQLVFGHIMASHNAHDPERREAYILKQLRHLSAWQGSLVHEVLATEFLTILREGRPFHPEALTAAAQALAQRQFAFSAAKRYQESGQTKSAAGNEYCALFEHEYGWEIPPETIAAVHERIAFCFENLASQRRFLSRLYTGSRYEAELPLSFRLNGITVRAVPDLVFLRADQQPTVIDWKVSKSETSDYSRQLLIYALAVARCGRWPGVHAEAIELYEMNLLKNEIRQHLATQEQLDEAEDFVYRSVVALEALVGTSKFDELDLSEFEVAEHPQTCFHCNFGPLCVRLLKAEGRSATAEIIQGRLW